MADEKDLPLRAAEVPPSPVSTAPGIAESAAPEVADGAVVPTATQDPSLECVSNVQVSLPKSLGVSVETFSRVLHAVTAAIRTEDHAAVGAVFWALAEGLPAVYDAILRTELHNRPVPTPEEHDPRTCQHPGCKSKRGQA
jgi:hypothetical protein